MKRLFTALLCATALLWSAGCSDDDEGIDAGQLTGSWEMTRQYDGEYDKWNEEFGLSYGQKYVIVFNGDGTGRETHTEVTGGHTYVDHMDFTYVVSGNRLRCVETAVDEPFEARIEKLTAQVLVLASDYTGEDGRRYTNRNYYERFY